MFRIFLPVLDNFEGGKNFLLGPGNILQSFGQNGGINISLVYFLAAPDPIKFPLIVYSFNRNKIIELPLHRDGGHKGSGMCGRVGVQDVELNLMSADGCHCHLFSILLTIEPLPLLLDTGVVNL